MPHSAERREIKQPVSQTNCEIGFGDRQHVCLPAAFLFVCQREKEEQRKENTLQFSLKSRC